jgi:hypothetical protein
VRNQTPGTSNPLDTSSLPDSLLGPPPSSTGHSSALSTVSSQERQSDHTGGSRSGHLNASAAAAPTTAGCVTQAPLSGTSPSARRGSPPTVLTLDDDGCFAGLRLPCKTPCPQRNLEASYLYNTGATHARMTLVSSGTTNDKLYTDCALSLEGGAAAAWALWLKNVIKHSADSTGTDRVTAQEALVPSSLSCLSQIESSAVGAGSGYSVSAAAPLNAGSSSTLFISDAAGQVSSLTRVHPEAAWVLLRLQAALMEACPVARPLSGRDMAECRYTFTRHQVRLPCQLAHR